MKIIKCDAEKFYSDFLPMIIEVQTSVYDGENKQHVAWLKHKVDISALNYGTFLCAYKETGEAIGYIWFEHDTGLEGVQHSGRHAYVKQFGVFKKFQRMGFGRKLLEAAVEQLEADGAECLYTDTYAGDDDALAFYVKTGFIPVALHPGLNGLDDFGQVYLYKTLV